jgi:hypothetical protein
MVLAATSISRILSSRQARITALRHDRRSGFLRELHDRGDFFGRAGPQHRRRAPMIEVALLGEVRCHRARCAQRIFLADDCGEAVDRRGGGGLSGRLVHGTTLAEFIGGERPRG